MSEDPGGFHTARDRTRPELLWFMRNEQVLDRWPILAEDWCRRVEDTRLSSVDRTPGAATFGR